MTSRTKALIIITLIGMLFGMVVTASVCAQEGEMPFSNAGQTVVIDFEDDVSVLSELNKELITELLITMRENGVLWSEVDLIVWGDNLTDHDADLDLADKRGLAITRFLNDTFQIHDIVIYRMNETAAPGHLRALAREGGPSTAILTFR